MRKDWIEITIDNLIDENGIFCDGDWVESKDQDPNGDVRLIQLADIGDGTFRNKSDRFLTSKKAKELNCTFLHEGDIILARMPEPLGRATIFPLKGDNKFVTVVDVAIIRSNSKCIDKKYLLYNINSPQIRKEIESLQSGTTRKRISRKNLSKIKFPLAPLPEQRAIVGKIEQLFSELDNGIANLKAAREKLEIYRQAVLKKAFEGELTREWRERLEQDGKRLPDAQDLLEQIKAERKAYYQQQLKAWQQSVIAWDAQGRKGKKPNKPKKLKEFSHTNESELSTLPVEWTWMKTGFISEVSGGVTKNSKRQLLSLKVPYLRVANVYANKLDLEEVLEIGMDEKEIERVLLKKDDLLIVEGNGSPDQIGRVAVWDGRIPNCVHQNHLIKARCFDVIRPQYLLYYLLSKDGRNAIKNVASSTSGLYTLSLTKVENLLVPVPSELEQTQIVQEIETRLSVCDKLGASIDESLEKAEALRQSILKKAFEGKLLSEAEVAACRNAPDWEPAAQLLARIKGKKEGVQGKLFEV